mgnify:CR=1 FL=1
MSPPPAPLRRFAAIGDLHGEDLRLEFVLTWLSGQGIDAVLAVGDLVDGAGSLDRCCALLTAHAAVDKLLDLELAIMLRHYQLDSEERLLVREHRIQDEKLGAMRTLTAGLAHEVRNPLNAAKLQLELVSRRIKRQGDDPKLSEPTRLVHDELERLAQLPEGLAKP